MNKKVIVLASTIVVVLAIVTLVIVNSLSNSPKGVVQRFVKAIEKNDMKALAEVATPNTVQFIAMLGSKVQGMIAAQAGSKPKSVTEAIDGDKAVVTILLQDDEEIKFDLVKVNGKWKVSIDMDFKGSSSPSYK
jgi:hypothetical protein